MTKTTSIPTKSSFFFDTPEPRNVEADFRIFRHVIDEKSSPDGTGLRSITLTWEAVSNTSNLNGENIAGKVREEDIRVALNAGEYISDLQIKGRQRLLVQDPLPKKTGADLLEASLNLIGLDADALPPGTGAESALLEFGSITPTGLEKLGSLAQEIQEKYFLSPETTPTSNDPPPTSSQVVPQAASIDSQVYADLLESAGKNSVFSTAPSLSYELSSARVIQQRAISSAKPNLVSDEDYGLEVVPIANEEANSVIGEGEVVGYLITKKELGSEGFIDSDISEDPFLYAPDASGRLRFVDELVKLSTTYLYSVSSVSLVKIPSAPESGSDELRTAYVLVVSNPRLVPIQTTSGYSPPPEDIGFIYENSTGRLHIGWGFGAGDTGTVKFQFFKRSSINEPYRLLRQYDFDNTTARARQNENIEYGLNVRLDNPLFYYVDENFSEFEEAYYSLCAINTNGSTSPLSAQYQVKYNPIIGDIEVRQFSPPGAPKQYPNFFLSNDLTNAVGQLSNVSEGRLYFTPDTFEIKLYNGEEEKTERLIYEASEGRYYLEVTDLNEFEQRSLKIEMKEAEDGLLSSS